MCCSDRTLTRLFCVTLLTYVTTTDVTLSPASSSDTSSSPLHILSQTRISNQTERDDFLSKIKSTIN